VTFDVKDSGKRMEFDSGMVRDVDEGKVRYDLVLDGPMFVRWATHLTKGAVKYEARNWMKATGEAERDRFRQSAVRHFIQWFLGDTDEDHASAVFFNINGAEYVGDGVHKPHQGESESISVRRLTGQEAFEAGRLGTLSAKLDAGMSLDEALWSDAEA
jgi:hypothetical protein